MGTAHQTPQGPEILNFGTILHENSKVINAYLFQTDQSSSVNIFEGNISP